MYDDHKSPNIKLFLKDQFKLSVPLLWFFFLKYSIILTPYSQNKIQGYAIFQTDTMQIKCYMKKEKKLSKRVFF